jgi:hypothetical protein
MSDVDPQISYSIRELIERLDKKIDSFISLLTTKADRADVLLSDKKLEDQVLLFDKRLDDHSERIGALEHSNVARKEVSEFRRWLVPTLFAIVLTLATVGSILASTLLH